MYSSYNSILLSPSGPREQRAYHSPDIESYFRHGKCPVVASVGAEYILIFGLHITDNIYEKSDKERGV